MAVSNELRDRRKIARILSGVLGLSGEDIIKAFEKKIPFEEVNKL